jgi:predicted metal-dependent hydrolase
MGVKGLFGVLARASASGGPDRQGQRARTLTGDPPVEIVLRPSARARRMTLRVSRLDGRVTLTLPPRVAEAEAMAFAESQRGWIAEALGRVAPVERPSAGGYVPFEGKPVEVRIGRVRAPVLEGGALQVPGPEARVPAQVLAFLKVTARLRLTEAADRHAAALGRPVRRITLRDPRARWGSCAPDGSLMFSWRLVMAPPDVLDYVAAHEVAHLAEMNHGPGFWAIVRTLYPSYERQRRWLRREGQALHAWDFGR